MAKLKYVWGIDIGQCGVKALRCREHESPDRLIAEAFDFIEYPKILSQPEADPAELIREAMQQFLSRNSVKGDRVAISVPGQNGLARFIKLPPVESKKVPDIVKYEARQQIPFPLNEVVWDYQQMAGGSEEDGFALETEVGLFAMKREQCARALQPFKEAGIEVDIVQLTPLALYNFISFDQLSKLPGADSYDPDNPPESVVVLSLGTETTDLVVTNGFRVWQRSIPLGGSHFTKALSKELKLTYAKAEHLKRNASAAENPKAIFQAMRPVFNDLVTEIQRSIGYFANIDRKAKISRIISLGNVMKLPGLLRYLQQNLGMEIDKVEEFRGLSGTNVVDSPIFKENVLAFGVAYGLVIQGLANAKINTNLVPPEIVKERMIRAKKPWAVAAAACLLVGITASFGGHWRAWNSVNTDKFEPALSEADQVTAQSQSAITAFTAEQTNYQEIKKVGDVLVSNIEGRVKWLEVLRAINACLPVEAVQPPPKDIHERNEILVTQVVAQQIPDLALWYATMGKWDGDKPAVPAADPNAPADPAAAAAAVPVPAAPPASPAVPADLAAAAVPVDPSAPPVGAGPTGEGWVFRVTGHHYHNPRTDRLNQGAQYVRDTFLKNLKEYSITLPAAAGKPPETVKIKELGIAYPIIINPGKVREEIVPDEEAYEKAVADATKAAKAAASGKSTTSGKSATSGLPVGGLGGLGGLGAGPGALGVPTNINPSLYNKKQYRFDFVVEFCWVETPPSVREKKAEDAQKAAAQAAAAQADGQAAPTAGGTN